jgi:OOP family OmpA-OmpF porin
LIARIFLCLGGFALFGAYAVHGPAGARQIEAKIQAIAAEQLERGGFGWANVRADGRSVLVSGEAPNRGELDAALAALRSAGAGAIDHVDSRGALVAAALKSAPTEPESGSLANSGKTQIGVETDKAQTDDRAATCQAAVNKALNGRRLTFQHNSAWLGARGRALLDEFAREISDCDDQTITIEGHTDASGTPEVNLNISERRAGAVKDYLDKLGLTAKFEIKGYGETRPIASNRSEAGRTANRRIDFVVASAPLESD